MIPHDRRQSIMRVLEREGSAQVTGLSQHLGVTEVTVRKDLEKLEAEGLIIKEHGGAILRASPERLLEEANRKMVNIDRKFAIGKKAAEFVIDGDTLIIDAGSTATQFSKCLYRKHNLTVITTSLLVGLNIGPNRTASLMMTGGQFSAASLAFTGPQAAEFFNSIHAEKLFISAVGVSLGSGLTYLSMDDVFIKRAMLRSARHTYLLADSTKIGRESLIKLGSVTHAKTLITDSGIADSDRELLEKKGIEVVVAAL